MVDAGLVKTRRWVLGAVLTALCSLAYARMPQAPHGGGGGGGFHPGIQHDVRNARAERGRPEDRGVRLRMGRTAPVAVTTCRSGSPVALAAIVATAALTHATASSTPALSHP
jgi:hypothetical protein